MKKLVLLIALSTASRLAFAGDALTQSLEHESSKGTVAERKDPSPVPAPTKNPNAISDRAAEKKIHYSGRPAKARRKPAPSPAPATK